MNDDLDDMIDYTLDQLDKEKEMKKLEVFDELIAFRAYREDKQDITAVAQQWQLDESEIARRALRAGLQILRNFKVPGLSRKGSKGTKSARG